MAGRTSTTSSKKGRTLSFHSASAEPVDFPLERDLKVKGIDGSGSWVNVACRIAKGQLMCFLDREMIEPKWQAPLSETRVQRDTAKNEVMLRIGAATFCVSGPPEALSHFWEVFQASSGIDSAAETTPGSDISSDGGPSPQQRPDLNSQVSRPMFMDQEEEEEERPRTCYQIEIGYLEAVARLFGSPQDGEPRNWIVDKADAPVQREMDPGSHARDTKVRGTCLRGVPAGDGSWVKLSDEPGFLQTSFVQEVPRSDYYLVTKWKDDVDAAEVLPPAGGWKLPEQVGGGDKKEKRRDRHILCMAVSLVQDAGQELVEIEVRRKEDVDRTMAPLGVVTVLVTDPDAQAPKKANNAGGRKDEPIRFGKRFPVLDASGSPTGSVLGVRIKHAALVMDGDTMRVQEDDADVQSRPHPPQAQEPQVEWGQAEHGRPKGSISSGVGKRSSLRSNGAKQFAKALKSQQKSGRTSVVSQHSAPEPVLRKKSTEEFTAVVRKQSSEVPDHGSLVGSDSMDGAGPQTLAQRTGAPRAQSPTGGKRGAGTRQGQPRQRSPAVPLAATAPAGAPAVNNFWASPPQPQKTPSPHLVPRCATSPSRARSAEREKAQTEPAVRPFRARSPSPSTLARMTELHAMHKKKLDHLAQLHEEAEQAKLGKIVDEAIDTCPTGTRFHVWNHADEIDTRALSNKLHTDYEKQELKRDVLTRAAKEEELKDINSTRTRPPPPESKPKEQILEHVSKLQDWHDKHNEKIEAARKEKAARDKNLLTYGNTEKFFPHHNTIANECSSRLHTDATERNQEREAREMEARITERLAFAKKEEAIRPADKKHLERLYEHAQTRTEKRQRIKGENEEQELQKIQDDWKKIQDACKDPKHKTQADAEKYLHAQPKFRYIPPAREKLEAQAPFLACPFGHRFHEEVGSNQSKILYSAFCGNHWEIPKGGKLVCPQCKQQKSDSDAPQLTQMQDPVKKMLLPKEHWAQIHQSRHVFGSVNNAVANRCGRISDNIPTRDLSELDGKIREVMQIYRAVGAESDKAAEGGTNLRSVKSRSLYGDGLLMDDDKGWARYCAPDPLRQLQQDLDNLMERAKMAQAGLMVNFVRNPPRDMENLEKAWPPGSIYPNPEGFPCVAYAFNPGPKTKRAAIHKAAVQYGASECGRRYTHVHDFARLCLICKSSTNLRLTLEHLLECFEVVSVRNHYNPRTQGMLGERCIEVLVVLKQEEPNYPMICEIRLEEEFFFKARLQVEPLLKDISRGFCTLYCRPGMSEGSLMYLVKWLLNRPKQSHALTVFRRQLGARYRSSVAAWRQIFGNDPHMSFMSFRETCANLKHREHTVEFWQDLDPTRSGFTSLFEFDEDAVLLLAKFLGRLMMIVPNGDKYEGRVLFQMLARKALLKPAREYMMDLPEFRSCVKPLGFTTAEIERLFIYIDGNAGLKVQPPATIAATDFDWLKTKFTKMVDLNSVILNTDETQAFVLEHVRDWADATKKEDLQRRELDSEPVTERVHRLQTKALKDGSDDETSPGDLVNAAENLLHNWIRQKRSDSGVLPVADRTEGEEEAEEEEEEEEVPQNRTRRGYTELLTDKPAYKPSYQAAAPRSYAPDSDVGQTDGGIGRQLARSSVRSMVDHQSGRSVAFTSAPSGDFDIDPDGTLGRFAESGSQAAHRSSRSPSESQPVAPVAAARRSSRSPSESQLVAPVEALRRSSRSPSDYTSPTSSSARIARISVAEAPAPAQPRSSLARASFVQESDRCSSRSPSSATAEDIAAAMRAIDATGVQAREAAVSRSSVRTSVIQDNYRRNSRSPSMVMSQLASNRTQESRRSVSASMSQQEPRRSIVATEPEASSMSRTASRSLSRGASQHLGVQQIQHDLVIHDPGSPAGAGGAPAAADDDQPDGFDFDDDDSF